VASLAAFCVAVALALPAGTSGADEDATLRIGTIQEFDSINPHLAFIASSAEATMLVYDTLVGLGPDLEYAPTGFAESWVREGSTWTFTIREGLRWSDGRSADADDVAFTYEYLLASLDPAYIGPWAPAGNDLPRSGATRGDRRPDNPLSLYGKVLAEAAGLTSVEAVDRQTVALTTDRPTTLLLGAGIPILPEHIWSSVTFAEAVTTFQAEPPVVGSGPFQVVEWQRGRSARFARNPFYWGRQPFLEEVQFRFYPDRTALLAALRRGEIDYARPVATDEFDALDAEADIVGVEGLGAGFTHVAFNTYGAPIDGGGASTPAVRDRRFRDALGYALDSDALIRDALDGHGTPGTTVIPPVFGPFHTEPARPRTFDVDEARQRLDDAGYPDSDGDGVREDQDGAPIDLELYYPTTESKYRLAARTVEAAWERVGIGVTPHGLEPDTLTELLYVPEAGGTAEYDAVLWGWTGSPDPDFLLSLFTTAEIGGWSDSNYASAAYDALFERQRRAATLEARQAVVADMLDLVYDDAPYHVLFYDDELHARRTDRFDGWTTQPRAGGVSVFAYGVQAYLDLVGAVGPSPTPASTAPDAPTPAAVPSAEPFPGVVLPPGGRTSLLVGILAVVGVLSLAMIVRRARRRSGP
jgi:peptide/nickel transport system substrate-binding protein